MTCDGMRVACDDIHVACDGIRVACDGMCVACDEIKYLRNRNRINQNMSEACSSGIRQR